MTSAAIPAPLEPAKLYALAPTTIASYRKLRYDGDGIFVGIDVFTPTEQAVVRTMYRWLSDLFALLRTHREEPEVGLARLREFNQSTDWQTLLVSVRNLASDQPYDPLLAKVTHDLRGGGFMALVAYLQMLDFGMIKPVDLQRLFFLARDHLKIMRNGVRGLDDPAYDRDREQRLHGVDLLVEKWSDGDHRLQAKQARVLVDCQYDGAISERCLEFSALDRVIYNLINNATAHSADEVVQVAILPLGEPTAHLRFVVYNRVTAEQQARLRERFPAGISGLFQGGFTTGGTGLGLRICADFVINAYGLGMVDDAINEGYIGATFVDEQFVAWFHWPVVAD